MGTLAEEAAEQPDMETRQHIRPETCQPLMGTAQIRALQAKDWERMEAMRNEALEASNQLADMWNAPSDIERIPSWVWIAIGIWLVAGYCIYLH